MFQVTTVLPQPHEPVSKIPTISRPGEEEKEEVKPEKKGKKEKK